MKIIRLLLKNSWPIFSMGAIASIVTGSSSAGLIALINYILQNIEQTTAWLVWTFIGLCLLLMISSASSWILLTSLSQDIIYNLRLELTQSIFACPLRQLEIIGTPKLLAALTEDLKTIANSSINISALGVNIALLLGCLVYLCWLSWSIFLIFFVFIIIGSLSYQFLVSKGNKWFKKARESQDDLFKHFQTVTQGTKELKLHRQRRQAFFQEDLKATTAALLHRFMKGMTIYSFATGYGLGLFFIPLGLMLLSLTKIMPISGEILSGYTLTFLYMITPLRGTLYTLPQLSQTNIALAKIESLGLSLTQQITERQFSKNSDCDASWKSLELVNVTHTYGNERDEHQFILGAINLEFQPGELVFIVGGNGSGKSTLVKLITGLYVPEAGNILFNGQPVTDENREWYRQQFSVVFSDFYLFERLLGIEGNYSENELQDYLIRLEIDNKVQVKDGVLSTLNLSQGQRKRLALLTAYLEDRPIYIFDEWASDQDPVFKEIFYKKLLPELKQRGKTVLVVSHDERYFQEADRIIKLDYGQVI